MIYYTHLLIITVFHINYILPQKTSKRWNCSLIYKCDLAEVNEKYDHVGCPHFYMLQWNILHIYDISIFWIYFLCFLYFFSGFIWPRDTVWNTTTSLSPKPLQNHMHSCHRVSFWTELVHDSGSNGSGSVSVLLFEYHSLAEAPLEIHRPWLIRSEKITMHCRNGLSCRMHNLFLTCLWLGQR